MGLPCGSQGRRLIITHVAGDRPVRVSLPGELYSGISVGRTRPKERTSFTIEAPCIAAALSAKAYIPLGRWSVFIVSRESVAASR